MTHFSHDCPATETALQRPAASFQGSLDHQNTGLLSKNGGGRGTNTQETTEEKKKGNARAVFVTLWLLSRELKVPRLNPVIKGRAGRLDSTANERHAGYYCLNYYRAFIVPVHNHGFGVTGHEQQAKGKLPEYHKNNGWWFCSPLWHKWSFGFTPQTISSWSTSRLGAWFPLSIRHEYSGHVEGSGFSWLWRERAEAGHVEGSSCVTSTKVLPQHQLI